MAIEQSAVLSGALAQSGKSTRTSLSHDALDTKNPHGVDINNNDDIQPLISRSSSLTTAYARDRPRSKSAVGSPPSREEVTSGLKKGSVPDPMTNAGQNISSGTPSSKARDAKRTTPSPRGLFSNLAASTGSPDRTIPVSPLGMPTPPLPESKPPSRDAEMASDGSFYARPARAVDVTREIAQKVREEARRQKQGLEGRKDGEPSTAEAFSAALKAKLGPPPSEDSTSGAKSGPSVNNVKNLRPIPFTPIIPQPVFKSFSSSQRYSARYSTVTSTTTTAVTAKKVTHGSDNTGEIYEIYKIHELYSSTDGDEI